MIDRTGQVVALRAARSTSGSWTRRSTARASREARALALLAAARVLVLAPAAALAATAARVVPRPRGRGHVRHCGVPLNIAESPRAEQQRELHPRRYRAGPDQGADQGRLVAQYGADDPRHAAGQAASASPRTSSRSRSSLAALVALAIALPRWRRRRRRRSGAAPGVGAADRSTPTTRAASTRTSRGTTAMLARRRRPGRHDGHRRLRGRLRVVHLAVRAAARARLPVGRSRASSIAEMRERRAQALARCSGRRSIFCLSFTVMFVALGMTRDRHRLDAARLTSRRSTRSPAS